MSEEKQLQESGLDFEKAKDMTVGEASRREAELQAGITESDSILDKYIKQHRDEVESQKFDTKISQMGTSDLDAFIKQQREELAATADNEPVAAADSVAPVAATVAAGTAVVAGLGAKASQAGQDSLDKLAAGAETAKDSILASGQSLESDQPIYKSKKAIIAGLGILFASIFAIGFAINQLNSQSSQTASSSSTSASSTASSSSESAQAQEAKASFDSLYASFYADEAQTQLKNSEFANLANLETALKALEGTSYYEAAKSQYDSLNRAITATQAVNDKFETAAIVDGQKVAATLKAGATFDDLSSETLNTGNASLDSLLQSVISEGRSSGATVAAAATDTAAAATGTASTDGASTGTAATENKGDTATTTASADAGAAVVSSPAVTSYGITSYDPAILQRQLSRVPYNDAALADVNNAAWTFNPGILETIVATAQERGHIVGNDYILERVNIVNGNGYYNMFKPDGTYLFSINAKTGYFVGNAPGRADALDY